MTWLKDNLIRRLHNYNLIDLIKEEVIKGVMNLLRVK